MRNIPISTRLKIFYILTGTLPMLLLSALYYYQSTTSIDSISRQYVDLVQQTLLNKLETQIDSLNTKTNDLVYDSTFNTFYQAQTEETFITPAAEITMKESVTTWRQTADLSIQAVSFLTLMGEELIFPRTDNSFSSQEYTLSDTVYAAAEQELGAPYFHLETLREQQIIAVTRKIYFLYENPICSGGYITLFLEDDFFQVLDALSFPGLITLKIGESVIYTNGDGLLSNSNYTIYETLEDYNLTLELSISTQVLNQDLVNQTHLLFFFSIVILFFSIFINSYFSRSITAPLKLLSIASQKISEGDFNINIKDDYHDEVSQLTESFNEMAEKLDHLVYENYEYKLSENDYKMKYLQMQINPHFLYNTLDSIRFKQLALNNNKAAEDIGHLSSMFRTMLTSQETIPLSQELKYVQSYIYFQQCNYGNFFDCSFSIPDDILNTNIMKFLLQPIVENSIQHARRENGQLLHIHISAMRKNHALIIEIKDDGIGTDKDILAEAFTNHSNGTSTHIGLRNIRNRIKTKYGETSDLSVTSTPQIGTTVTLSMKCFPDLPEELAYSTL